jgi:hypothetical protein
MGYESGTIPTAGLAVRRIFHGERHDGFFRGLVHTVLEIRLAATDIEKRFNAARIPRRLVSVEGVAGHALLKSGVFMFWVVRLKPPMTDNRVTDGASHHNTACPPLGFPLSTARASGCWHFLLTL